MFPARHVGQDDARDDFLGGGVRVRDGCGVFVRGCVLPDDFREGGVPPDGDLIVLQDPLGEDRGGAEGVAAVHHRDGLAGPGEHQRFLHGRIPPAHHHHVLVKKRRPVTRRTRTDAAAPHLVLPRHLEPPAVRPRRHHHRVRLHHRPRLRGDPQDPLAPFLDGRDGVCLEQGARIGRLFPHLGHEARTRVRCDPRVVLHVHALALELPADGGGDYERGEAGAGRVEGRGEAGGSAADDGDALGEVALGPGVCKFGLVVLGLLFFLLADLVQPFLEFLLQLLERGQLEVRFVRFAPLLGAGTTRRSLRVLGLLLRQKPLL
mmetsp:Transcript_32326/g.64028  ORF Transcript_32326/g.64028 Transcript_32326/m.64028 type:complete len:319 (-) Transcript_32326:406-1362(-)